MTFQWSLIIQSKEVVFALHGVLTIKMTIQAESVQGNLNNN